MKKFNKKGFTIVELVIVIAVIAILAAVLIPTFSTVIKKANESAALQAAKANETEYYAACMADGKVDSTESGKGQGGYTFTYTDNVLTKVEETAGNYTFTVSGGVITAATKAK